MEFGEFLERMRDAGVTSGISIRLGDGDYQAEYCVMGISEDNVAIGGIDGSGGKWNYRLNPRNNLLRSPVEHVTLREDIGRFPKRVVGGRHGLTLVTIGDVP